jgi:hypothetical protein
MATAVRVFDLVNGTEENGTWTYFMEMDPASSFYYSVGAYDGTRISSTGQVLYVGEGAVVSISDVAYASIVAAIVVGTAILLFLYARRAGKSL